MKTRRGFILITAAVSMIGLLLLVGLAVDTGRLYVVRSELQVFADEAAIAAAYELDGTSAGLTRALNVAASGPAAGTSPNRWNFSTQLVTGVTTQFASAPAGPYDANPTNAAGLRFVKVHVSGPIPMYFLPLVPSIAATQAPTATSIAGQTPQT